MVRQVSRGSAAIPASLNPAVFFPGRSCSNIWKSSPGKGATWWLLPTSAWGRRRWIAP